MLHGVKDLGNIELDYFECGKLFDYVPTFATGDSKTYSVLESDCITPHGRSSMNIQSTA